MRKGYRWGLQLMLCLTTIAVHSQTTLLTQDFNGADPPAGWLKFNTSTGGTPALAAWTIRPDGYFYSSFWGDVTFHSNDNSQFYLSNSDAQGPTAITTETILQSPSFSTATYSYISLRFYHHFREYQLDTGYVEVSTDGTNWTAKDTIYADSEDSVGAANAFALRIVNLNVYGNNPTVYIRFRYHAEFGYYWAIDNVTVLGSNSPMPVNLVNFSGYRSGNRNLLKWTTASEQNNLGFRVERSLDGINYSSIGFVQSLAPSGNSVSSMDYYHSDNNLAGDKQYYRLRQIDFDSREKFSNVILIKGDNPAILSISSIFPNPASNHINVRINAPNPDHIILRVTDMTGRLVNQKNAVIDKGSNNISIDLTGLTSGTYFLKVIAESGTETISSKFIKQ